MKQKKRCLFAVIAMLFVFSAASCGEKEDVSSAEDSEPEIVYVPEYLEAKGDEEGVISYDILQNEDQSLLEQCNGLSA